MILDKTYLDTIKTLAQGTLGGLTFGMYHFYVTNNMMEEFNKENRLKNQKWLEEARFNSQESLDKMEAQHKAEMDELRTKMAALERRSWW